MTDMTLREQMYRRWKKGEDYCVLAKEMGVTRERMRIILRKMDADVPLLDRIEAQTAEIERLRGDLAKAVEALELIVVDNTWGLEHETYMKCRTTLAEIKGESHE